MGRSGSWMPARERRMASVTFSTASSWPMTRWWRISSSRSSLSRSPSISLETGIPVHRRGQNRACQGAGRGAVWWWAEPDPYRHDGVHGEIQRIPPDRRTSGICGLWWRRITYRSCEKTSLFGNPFRWNRESTSRHLQYIAPSSRWRSTYGQQRKGGRF